MDYTTEVQTKLDRARSLMDEQGVDALWLRTVNNVAWITGGMDVAVNTADTVGVASVLITQDRAQVITSNIEGPRLVKEDQVEARGFEVIASPWEQGAPLDVGGTLGVDLALEHATDLSRPITLLRSRLLPVERDRFRVLGRACADAMATAMDRVRPGMTEYEIAAVLSGEQFARGVTPIVTLIATDERIFNYRHPLPTAKRLDKYAMLVLCGRQEGLVCSATRLIHFGAQPDELKEKMQACAIVDARVNAGSKPDVSLEALLALLQDAYAEVGFADEWRLHHQGGTAGYAARELIAVPGEASTLETGMICAWNPSITGVKIEDTILVTENGPEILTEIAGWPAVPVEVDGITLARPVIKEV